MQEFKEKFEAYGGDYVGTIERFMGNEALYVKFLKMLSQDTNLEKLGKALESDDLSSAFDAAHTLKGVAGNLGLTPFYQALCEIVEPLRHGKPYDYKGAYDAICAEYQRVQAFNESLTQDSPAE